MSHEPTSLALFCHAEVERLYHALRCGDCIEASAVISPCFVQFIAGIDKGTRCPRCAADLHAELVPA